MMKRWSLGLLVTGFFAGMGFVLFTILLNIFRTSRHEIGQASQALPMAIAAFFGLAALLFWLRVTRPD